MANSLGESLTDRFVVLRSRGDRTHDRGPCYRGSVIERVFVCRGGFGCSDETSGTMVTGEFVFDADYCGVRGYGVLRFATDDEVERAMTIRRDNLRGLEVDHSRWCPSCGEVPRVGVKSCWNCCEHDLEREEIADIDVDGMRARG